MSLREMHGYIQLLPTYQKQGRGMERQRYAGKLGRESIEEPRTYTPYIYLSICLSTSVAAASAAAAELNKNKGMSRGLLLIYL